MKTKTMNHPIKLTALLTLAEAVRSRSHMKVNDIVSIAREFGATNREVERVFRFGGW